MLSRIAIVLSLFCLNGLCLSAQTFSLRQINDTCNVLVLTTDSMSDEWLLPHPVYQFRTGDVDGDGVEEALVGVVKSTRFYPEKGNRLFVFKNRDGISIERCWNGQYNLDEWEWSRFGPRFSRYILTNATLEEVNQTFNQYEKNTGHSRAVDAHPHGMEPTN